MFEEGEPMADLQELIAEMDRRRALEERQVGALIDSLPPLRGSLTASEADHVRMLRAVSDRTFQVIASFTREMLLRDAERGQLAQTPRIRLHVVVDNEMSPRR
jgi:hypothetical protein